MNFRNSRIYLLLALCLLLLAACASPGNPSGGPRDEAPPVLVKANPMPFSVDFKGNRVVLEFDELVNVKEAFSKVTVSPTSKNAPRVSSVGRRVVVTFQDTLAANTTYSIDFGNSIEDNNEANKLQNFNMTFSTGEVLDTLRISGVVLGARDLEPKQQMLVGIHTNLADTAFRFLPLERITKTDDHGRFTIRGLKPGSYRVYALGDVNNDLRWDNPGEDLAFYDVEVTPWTEPVEYTDTIRNAEGKPDSVVTRTRTRFFPDDILLSAFNTGYKAQYLTDYTRPDSTRLQLIFNDRLPHLPGVKIVGAPGMKDWFTLEKSRYNDTLVYWLRPRSLISADTLRLAVTYERTDSGTTMKTVTDTLRFLTHRTPVKKKKPKKDEKPDSIEPIKFLDVKMPGNTFEVYSPVIMEFGTPLADLKEGLFHLETKVDTVWKPLVPSITPVRADTLNPRRYKIEYPWDYGGEYRLTADSIAATGIYGLFTAPLKLEFKVKKQEDYSNLRLKVSGLPDTVPAFVELLNSSDSPVRIAKLENGQAIFSNVAPGQYYARLVEDSNGNGEYDPGDFDTHRQPEAVYYYPKKLTLKKNWDVDQSWNVNEVAVDLQKPAQLRKAKYDEEKSRRNSLRNDSETEEEEDLPFDPNVNPFDPNSKNRYSKKRQTVQ